VPIVNFALLKAPETTQQIEGFAVDLHRIESHSMVGGPFDAVPWALSHGRCLMRQVSWALEKRKISVFPIWVRHKGLPPRAGEGGGL
jgi:hypothetical protein